MNSESNTLIFGKHSIKPITGGILIGVLGTIAVTNFYWFILMRLYIQDSPEDSILPHNRLLILALFYIGAFALPLIGASLGGYFTARFSKIAPFVNCIVVGLGGIILCFGYIFIYGADAHYPQVYTILGFLWVPASMIGGYIFKMTKTT